MRATARPPPCLARPLGAALARLHAAGFDHPDLYAKHVLRRSDGRDAFTSSTGSARAVAAALTWRRRVPRPGRPARHRSPTTWPTPRERLACLRAYLPRPLRAWPTCRMACRAWSAAQVAGPLQAWCGVLRRRHIREKRQPPPAERAGLDLPRRRGAVRDARLWHAPGRRRGSTGCRWTASRSACDRTGDSRAAGCRCRRRAAPAGAAAQPAGRWPRCGPGCAARRRPRPEQRQAGLLFRLQRHGVAAPRVLAMGRALGAPGACRIVPADRAGRRTPCASTPGWRPAAAPRPGQPAALGAAAPSGRPAAPAARGRLLPRAVRFGRRRSPSASANGERRASVLASADGLRCAGAGSRASRVATCALSRVLTTAGCGRTDLRRFARGYRAAPTRRCAGPCSRERSRTNAPCDGRSRPMPASLAAPPPPSRRSCRERDASGSASSHGVSPAASATRLGGLRRRRLGRPHHGRGRHRPLPRQAGPLHRPLDAARPDGAAAGAST